jgi:hypothetical protein
VPEWFFLRLSHGKIAESWYLRDHGLIQREPVMTDRANKQRSNAKSSARCPREAIAIPCRKFGRTFEPPPGVGAVQGWARGSRRSAGWRTAALLQLRARRPKDGWYAACTAPPAEEAADESCHLRVRVHL